MSAKEMFEDLGYHYDKTSNKIVIFEVWFHSSGEIYHEEILRFIKIGGIWILKPKKGIILRFNKQFDIRLFKAINKQIEELGGWNDVED